MPDQAHDLRQLTIRRERFLSPRCERHALVAVTGGKGGVGATTVALNLAIASAKAGRRVLFLDADPRGGDAAILCGIEERHTLADVLAGRRTWDEAVRPGPSGVRLIAGERGWLDREGSPTCAVLHLLERLSIENLGADLAVVDAGDAFGVVARHVCREADAAVIVTTSEPAAVVDTFMAIKSMPRFAHWHVAVNRTSGADEAKMVHARLAQACRRLLSIELSEAGLMAATRPLGKNRPGEPIELNLEATTTDTVRRLSAADLLLSWKRHVEFDASASQALQTA